MVFQCTTKSLVEFLYTKVVNNFNFRNSGDSLCTQFLSARETSKLIHYTLFLLTINL